MSALEKEIESIARGVFDQMRAELTPASVQETDEAQDLRRKMAKIRAKESITYIEAALLLGVSDAHLRNVVDKAIRDEVEHPIPFRDIEGVITFNPDALLEWAQIRKKKVRKLKAVK